MFAKKIEFGQQRALRLVDNNRIKPVNIVDPLKPSTLVSHQSNKENNTNCVKNESKENPIEKENPKPAAGNRLESRIPIMKSRIPLSKSGSNLQAFPNSKLTEDLGRSNIVRSYSQLVPIENIDNDTNCFLLSDYAPEIYKYLRELETKQSIPANFLSLKNPAITANMRSILINWLINVHSSFQLCSETLYICVSIIDRFFAREPVPKNKIQLVGATALFVAAKFEEIYYPDIQEFVVICDRLYTKKDIIRMELRILEVLRFELGKPVPLHFLRRASKAAKVDGRTHMIAKYLCEMTLIQYECAHWKPSQIAVAALYIACRCANMESKLGGYWNSTLEHYTHYSEPQVLKWASVLCRFILNAEENRFQNCRNKYSHSRYLEIANSSCLKLPFIRQLASSAEKLSATLKPKLN